MKKLIVLSISTLIVGCASTEYDLQDVPNHLLHTDDKYATIEPVVNPEELKKGPDFPAG